MRRVLGTNYIMTLVELEYTMKNPSALVWIREGSMSVGKVLGSVLVHGFNDFLLAWS